MNQISNIEPLAESEIAQSDKYIRGLKSFNFNPDDVIPVTFYDQQCFINSNKLLKTKLIIASCFLAMNVLISTFALMNSGAIVTATPSNEVLESVLNTFSFVELNAPQNTNFLTGSFWGLAWLVLSVLASMFVLVKNIDHINIIDEYYLKFGSYLTIDNQPVIPSESVIKNANSSSFLKRILMVSLLMSVNGCLVFWSLLSVNSTVTLKSLEGEIGTMVNSSTNYHRTMNEAKNLIKKKYSGPLEHFMNIQLLMKYEPIIDPYEFESLLKTENDLLLKDSNLNIEHLNDLKNSKNDELIAITMNPNFDLISSRIEMLK